MRQAVTVSDSAEQVTTDAADNLDVVTMDRDMMNNLPVFDQNYVGAMSQQSLPANPRGQRIPHRNSASPFATRKYRCLVNSPMKARFGLHRVDDRVNRPLRATDATRARC